MDNVLLQIIGIIAAGQTGLLVTIAMKLGRLEAQLPEINRRLNTLDRRKS